MSVLTALARAYERLPDSERPRPGFSLEKIGFLISLHPDGSIANLVDLREGEGAKKKPRLMLVPQPVKRTAGVAPNFLWDKTAYVLGVTGDDKRAGEKGQRRTAEEHAQFVAAHEARLVHAQDEGLQALLAFLRGWSPQRFAELGWPDELKDQNVVFSLESDRLRGIHLHDRPAALALIGLGEEEAGQKRESVPCLVSGIIAPAARLHPSIKGVWGAQSSGAALVSFNLDAFTSYGHGQGDNAPVSEHAAFAYTTALNYFLRKGSGHRIQIGDASTVFWAESVDREAADLAEDIFVQMVEPGNEERAATQKIHDQLARLRRGERLSDIEPKLASGVRFYVLGLSPNAARLSVRFYFEDDFGVLAENYRTWLQDMALEPWSDKMPPLSIRRCELRTAPARRDKNGRVSFDTDAISPLLAGEFLRAVLSGSRLPAALLSLLLLRVRGDGLLDPLRAALIKAIIVRAMRLDGRLPLRTDGTSVEDYLMRSDPDDPNPARRLGRLFAVIERAQASALGGELNATVADKFLGAASATPGKVMAQLIRAAREHHIKRLRNGHADAKWIKDSAHARRTASALERDIGLLVAGFSDGFPAQLSPEEQGLFLVGYYQERYGPKGSKPGADDGAPDDIEPSDNSLDGEE